MKKKISTAPILLLTMIVFLLTSCSQSKEDQYIGYWIEDGKEHSELLEIKREGEKLYVKSTDLESPGTYNKEDKTLSAQLSNGLGAITLLMNIADDPKKMKMSINNETATFSKVTKEEAEKYKKETEAYYNPNFFVGEWKSDVEQEKPLKLIKEGDSFYYVSDFLGKQKLIYDRKKHHLIGNIGITSITIKRSGDSEITAYGKKYKKIK